MVAAGVYAARWTEQRGKRPVRIANCSGYKGIATQHVVFCGSADHTIADPGYHMRYQAELGDVDFITGDYLAGR